MVFAVESVLNFGYLEKLGVAAFALVEVSAVVVMVAAVAVAVIMTLAVTVSFASIDDTLESFDTAFVDAEADVRKYVQKYRKSGKQMF